MSKRLQETINVFNSLIDDVINTALLLATDDSETNRRSHIRAVFALVESDTYERKQLALERHDLGKVKFSAPELSILREEAAFLSNNAVAEMRQQFYSAAPNARFAMEMFLRAYGLGIKIDYTGKGWQSFTSAIQIRNRLTHPKSASDVRVSKSDMAIIDAFSDWYRKTSLEVIRRAMEVDD